MGWLFGRDPTLEEAFECAQYLSEWVSEWVSWPMFSSQQRGTQDGKTTAYSLRFLGLVTHDFSCWTVTRGMFKVDPVTIGDITTKGNKGFSRVPSIHSLIYTSLWTLWLALESLLEMALNECQPWMNINSGFAAWLSTAAAWFSEPTGAKTFLGVGRSSFIQGWHHNLATAHRRMWISKIPLQHTVHQCCIKTPAAKIAELWQ